MVMLFIATNLKYSFYRTYCHPIALHSMIADAVPWPSDMDNFSNPECTLRIPFLFAGEKPIERFTIHEHTFTYMGREAFKGLLDSVEKLYKTKHHRLFVHGIRGCGKSFLLAALACYLRRKYLRVVYLPDCRAMLRDFVDYFKTALLLTFSDNQEYQLKIWNCTNEDEIYQFCTFLKNKGIRLLFILDQLNALDPEEGTRDVPSNDQKSHIRQWLEKVQVGHRCIRSTLTNNNTAIYLSQNKTDEIEFRVKPGLSVVRTRQLQIIFLHANPFIE